ncbi:hypothetical protein Tco_0840728 [Tanacetum coccineum]|uniref:Retroviral polymerase SH3-like domain-containing protein n=1 Tax=Tanacetum coccineum TaxID=301880 RepID=A0ABQ5AVH2_9ASTR
MKEKGDSCILVGYSTTSKGYIVYNKITRLIFESIHINFDEIKELSKASDYENSVPSPPLQFEHNSSSLGIHDHNNEPSSSKLVPLFTSSDTDAPSLQELDLFCIHCNDEFFHSGTFLSVNNSSSPTGNSNQQDTQPTTNVKPTTKPITLITIVHAEENTDNQAADAHFEPYEFINPFCTLVQEVAESSSRNVDKSNMHTFYQLHQFENRWTKDHPLEQVRGNPSKPVQTR